MKTVIFILIGVIKHNVSCIINDTDIGKNYGEDFSKSKKICWYYESLGKCY